MGSQLAPLLREVSSQHQFTVIGDSDHSDARLPRALAQSENIKALVDSGVRHLFLERPQHMDSLLRRYESGEFTDDHFRILLNSMTPSAQVGLGAQSFSPQQAQEVALAMADLIIAAKENGIKVHFVDDSAVGQKLDQLVDVTAKTERKIIDFALASMDHHQPAAAEQLRLKLANEGITHEFGNQIFAHLKSVMSPSQLNTYFDEAMSGVRMAQDDWAKARIDGDRELAQRILGLAGTEKATIFYGNAHGLHQDDLDNHLGDARRIVLASKIEALDLLHPVASPLMDKSRKADERAPVAVYLVDQDKVYRSDSNLAETVCASDTIDLSRLNLCDINGLKPENLAAEYNERKARSPRAMPDGP